MRKAFATRQTSDNLRCFRHSSRRGDAIDGLVLMMASVLLVGWILGHLLLSLYPQTASAADSPSTANSVASTDGDESNGGLGEKGSTEGGPTGEEGSASGTDTDDPNATPGESLASNDGSQDAELQKHIERASELESEVDSLKTTNQQLLAENSSLKNAPPMLPSSIDEAEVSKLRDDLQSVNEQLSMAEKNALAANQQLQNSETSYQELQTRLNDVQTALTQTESDLAIAKADQKTASDFGASSPFANMPGEQENDAANDALIEEVEQAKAKVGRLETRISTLEDDLKTTTDKVTTREQELESAKRAAEQLKLAAQQLKTRNDELATKLENAAKVPAAKLPKEVYRDFVSSKGSVSKMAFIRWEGNDEIIVRSFEDKRLYRLPLERFSAADKKYLIDRK